MTCSLPVAMALILYWKLGRIGRGHVLSLMPFVAIGAPMALVTVHFEKIYTGAEGADWSLGFLERMLIAGKAVWFYLQKLLWPVDLTFSYPRWSMDAGDIFLHGLTI